MLLIKNALVYAPEKLGHKDILVVHGKIAAMADKIDLPESFCMHWDAQGKIVAPGFIDQHIHITGAGGKHGFGSMTPEITCSELVACGSTTVVGLLGTDGATRNIKSLYAKTQALASEGLTAYMFTGFYGLDPTYITNSLQDDLMFVAPVLGCKIAISDIRSDYPTDLELVRLLRQIKVGGMLAGKKGILHFHLGNLSTKMDCLFRLVKEYEFPISAISPTHVGRTKELFEEAIAFALLGGSIDITTGASKFTNPHLCVLDALEKGVSNNLLTFSSDGNAGLDKLDASGKLIGFRRAPIDQNYQEFRALAKTNLVPLEVALKVITSNPARNLGLKNKGTIALGADADFCMLNEAYELEDVMAHGKWMMSDKQVLAKGHFE